MDELRGDQAAWGFDGESVSIRYETKGWFRNPLLKFLGVLEVPVGVIDKVDFRPGAGRRNGWVMNLRLHEGMDPYAAAGSALDDKAQPFRLTGPARTELVAEYLADQLRFAAGQAEAPDPLAPTRLVPALPLHIRTCEGTARLEPDLLTLAWEGAYASGRTKRGQRREYGLADITGVEWAPANSGGWGLVRVFTRENAQGTIKPRDDLGALRTGMDASSNENYHAFLLAATLTAHLWARDLGAVGVPGAVGPAPGPSGDDEWIFGQIERLGDLRAKGLITDEEFNAKKAELLDRI
ncbi:hypothetical protein GCM10007079_13160 [Nocardiopsis terrae]|uniref:Short C-terminal domain-containing protein n=1 Tax=Nocardiopsis terrae TaxID=372655 RepID=A0ABR9HBS4_9ACTN|nr:DUF4429 domain-containing protein [Nocardiopsis terrae]MBE1456477.1 hypothetical protein [Nocardiopsis terrae]GHC76656.1 hypothetical protein GCM10007079_13160 [Nocardiopsis terrae]